MYFEPSKKTYYRFPSNKSSTEHYTSLIFPEVNYHSSEDDLTFESHAESNKELHRNRFK